MFEYPILYYIINIYNINCTTFTKQTKVINKIEYHIVNNGNTSNVDILNAYYKRKSSITSIRIICQMRSKKTNQRLLIMELIKTK